MTNKELDKYIVKFLEGEESCFDSIYHETKESVYLSIYSIIKDKTTIEDLMQDTYMKAINALASYTIGTNFKAWISRIAKNNTFNYLKKKNRESIINANERPDVYGSTSEDYLLDFAIKNLNDLEKDIVIYKIILNFKFREIADIINLPLGTVYWHYRNALKKMKEEIHE